MANVISNGQLAALEWPQGQFPQGFNAQVFNGPITSLSDLLGQEVAPLDVWATQPSVRKVIDFIARALASTPLKTYRRVSDTDRQRVTDHPLPRVLAAPSAGMTPFRFWHSVVVDWMMFDRWCVMKAPTTDPSRLLDLVRVQAARVAFADDGLGRVSAVWVDGKTKLAVADLLLDHGYAPITANGITPMATLAAILQESREAVAYRRSVWKNSARAPAVITRPATAPPWSEPAKQRFLAGWKSYARSGGREGDTPILEDGMTLSASDAFKPVDTADLEGRQLADAEVASAFHIAPELVGAREGTYSNVQAFREMLYGDGGVGPLAVALEQVINSMLVPEFDTSGELYVEFDIDAKLRGSFAEQATMLSTSVGRPWMTAAEARARVNLPDIGGDSDGLVTPLNVIIGGQASPRDSGSQNVEKSRSVRFKARAADSYEKRASQVLGDYFARQRKTVLAALGKKADADWWDGDKWDSELSDDLFRLSNMVASEIGPKTAEQLGFTTDDYDVDRTIAFLRSVSNDRAADINATTKAQIDAALEAGDDPEQVFDTAQNQRGPSAAAVLVTWASAFGTTEAARQVSGGKATKTWITGVHPRASHAALNGETVGIDEKFSNGLAWPGDSGPADEVAGCNCGVSVST